MLRILLLVLSGIVISFTLGMAYVHAFLDCNQGIHPALAASIILAVLIVLCVSLDPSTQTEDHTDDDFH